MPLTNAIAEPAERAELAHWLSIVGGAALVAYGLRRPTPAKLAAAALGGLMVSRGLARAPIGQRALQLSGGVRQLTGSRPIHVRKSVTVARSTSDVYEFFRDFRNLPTFMKHLAQVEPTGHNQWHWTVHGPGGVMVEWDAEVTEEVPGQCLAWKTSPQSILQNAGRVEFKPAPGGRGTEVTVTLQYQAPAGRLGRAVAKALGREPDLQLRGDLRRLKQRLEAGEVVTSELEPAGDRGGALRRRIVQAIEEVRP